MKTAVRARPPRLSDPRTVSSVTETPLRTKFVARLGTGQQVMPVYQDFVARFPTFQDAVAADERELADILRPLGRTAVAGL